MRGAIALAVVAAAAAFGRAAEPEETITVTASATVFARPNSARLHYAVRATEETADAAKEAAAKQAGAVTAALKDLKLDRAATTTGPASYSRRVSQPAFRGGGFPGGAVNPGGNPAPRPGPQTTFSGSVPLTTTVRESDPDNLRSSVDSLMRKLIEAGVDLGPDGFDPDAGFGPGRGSTAAPRIEWLLSDDTAQRQEAYRAAVRKAKANAQAISKEIGWETLRVVSVTDGPAGPREPGDTGGPAPRTPAGEVAVTARVTLKCSR
jgi:uncharacterized protein YggE